MPQNMPLQNNLEEEEIFETPDAPQERMLPAQYTQHQTINKENIDELDVAPEKAFQAFVGKTLDTNGMNFSDSLEKLHPRRTEYAIASIDDALESPLQRFTRLREEIVRLGEDLELLYQSKQVGGGNAPATMSTMMHTAEELGDMNQGLALLSGQLEQMGTTEAYAPFLTSPEIEINQTLALQKEMSHQMFHDIQQLKQQLDHANQNGENTTNDPGALSYELFYVPDGSTSKGRKTNLSSQLAHVEQRIATFEQLVGRQPNPTKDPILTSMSKLESRLNLLHESNLDTLSNRISTLTNQFELLNRQRHEPNAMEAIQSKIESEKITTLYEAYDDLSDMDVLLPGILQRLQSLKKVHDETFAFTDRLKQMEANQLQLSQMLGNDQDLLRQMEKSMQENLTLFQKNIQVLDQHVEMKHHPNQS